MDIRIEYQDPETLNRLIPHLSEKNCSISATLKPVSLLEQQVSRFEDESYFREVEAKIEKSLNETEKRIISDIKRCNALEVWPFGVYHIRPYDGAGVMGIAHEAGRYFHSHEQHPEIVNIINEAFQDPTHMATGRKFYGINFEERGGSSVESFIVREVVAAKRAMLEFIAKGYRVTDLEGLVNPRCVTRDHYYDTVEFDMSFRASDGVIIFRGVPQGAGVNIKEIEKYLAGGKEEAVKQTPLLASSP